MKSEPTEAALAHAAATLHGLGIPFALVGGLAVSVRSEVRFTRDVDIAVAVADDNEAEDVIDRLRAAGYSPVATVEQERHERLATARLRSPSGMVVDLVFASSGIEGEVVRGSGPRRKTAELAHFPSSVTTTSGGFDLKTRS